MKLFMEQKLSKSIIMKTNKKLPEISKLALQLKFETIKNLYHSSKELTHLYICFNQITRHETFFKWDLFDNAHF